LVDTSVGSAADEGVYLLGRDDGGLQVKRVQPLALGRLRLISDNAAYPPVECAPGDLSVKGAVVLVSQRVA